MIRLQTVVAVLLGVALAASPLPAFAAEPEAAAEPATDAAAPAEGSEPAAEPGAESPADEAAAEPAPAATDDGEDPLAEPVETPSKAEPKAPPPKEPKPKRERKFDYDPIGLSLALAGYASVIISIGLAAGMGIRFQRGKDANQAVMDSTTPDMEQRRIDAFANGARANESAKKFGIAAGVLFGIGVILIGTGHGLIVRKKKMSGDRAQLTPTFGRQGAGLSYRLRF